MIVIDATDTIVGRMATYVAKEALKGEKIAIVNCENAVLTGNKDFLFDKFKNKQDMGTPTKGPFLPRMPDRFVRRMIRGMLPYKKPRGREAFANVMCYLGIPERYQDAKKVKLDNASVEKLPNLQYVRVIQICRHLGYKGA